MDRKLNATMMALSASGLFLLLTIMAATPVDGTRGGPPATDTAPAFAAEDADAPDRSRGKAARRGLAMPYFSFAHGVRRIGG
jgi:hypothetical protein